MSSDKFHITIDGNDGTGKTSVINIIKLYGYNISDRGLPTLMVDNMTLHDDGNFYIILDTTPEICQNRIKNRGDDITEKYHCLDDLIYYRQRFLDISLKLKNCIIIDSSGNIDDIVKNVLHAIQLFSRQLE